MNHHAQGMRLFWIGHSKLPKMFALLKKWDDLRKK
jgi:hypothetical protein